MKTHIFRLLQWLKMIKFFYRGPNLLGICIIYGLVIGLGKLSNDSGSKMLFNFFDATFLFLLPAFLHNYLVIVFFDQKRYSLYFLIVLLGLIVFPFASHGFRILFYQYATDFSKTIWCSFVDFFIFYIFIIISLTLYRIWKRSRETSQAKLLLHEMELKVLTTQIHPHFLFNTLNALYCMSLKNDSSLPQSLLKLSEMMRYLLDAGKKESVLLSEEIEYLENYVALERIRIGTKANILFVVEGNSVNQRISPMLLLPFVENAFKHGIEKAGLNAYVEIYLDIQEQKMFMQVINSKPVLCFQQTDNKSGTGLVNVRRRLELLYPNKFELQIHNKPEKYEILLVLNF